MELMKFKKSWIDRCHNHLLSMLHRHLPETKEEMSVDPSPWKISMLRCCDITKGWKSAKRKWCKRSSKYKEISMTMQTGMTKGWQNYPKKWVPWHIVLMPSRNTLSIWGWTLPSEVEVNVHEQELEHVEPNVVAKSSDPPVSPLFPLYFVALRIMLCLSVGGNPCLSFICFYF